MYSWRLLFLNLFFCTLTDIFYKLTLGTHIQVKIHIQVEIYTDKLPPLRIATHHQFHFSDDNSHFNKQLLLITIQLSCSTRYLLVFDRQHEMSRLPNAYTHLLALGIGLQILDLERVALSTQPWANLYILPSLLWSFFVWNTDLLCHMFQGTVDQLLWFTTHQNLVCSYNI